MPVRKLEVRNFSPFFIKSKKVLRGAFQDRNAEPEMLPGKGIPAIWWQTGKGG